MESIKDIQPPAQWENASADGLEYASGGSPLDIYRKTLRGSSSGDVSSDNSDASSVVDPSSVDGSSLPSSTGLKTFAGNDKSTAKNTPAETYSREDKRKWKYARDAETRDRQARARAIALGYVNADGLSEEEKARRLSVFGSFLKCSKTRDSVPLELLRQGDSLVPVGEWRFINVNELI